MFADGMPCVTCLTRYRVSKMQDSQDWSHFANENPKAPKSDNAWEESGMEARLLKSHQLLPVYMCRTQVML